MTHFNWRGISKRIFILDLYIENSLSKIINLSELLAPSKKKTGIFSDIVQKGGRGSSSNHLFKCLRKNDKLQGGGGPPGCCHYLIS